MYVYDESTNTTSTATLKFLLSPFHLPPLRGWTLASTSLLHGGWTLASTSLLHGLDTCFHFPPPRELDTCFYLPPPQGWTFPLLDTTHRAGSYAVYTVAETYVISTKHFAHTLAALFPSPAAPCLPPPSPTASASSLPPWSYSKCNIRTGTPLSTSEPEGAKIMG